MHNYNHQPKKTEVESFIKNRFVRKVEPDDFDEVARESRENLSVENLRALVKEVEKRVQYDKSVLNDIWIKGKDGTSEGLDKEQFFKLCSMIGEPITPEELDEMLREADFDGDGNIDAEEFKRIISYLL